MPAKKQKKNTSHLFLRQFKRSTKHFLQAWNKNLHRGILHKDPDLGRSACLYPLHSHGDMGSHIRWVRTEEWVPIQRGPF